MATNAQAPDHGPPATGTGTPAWVWVTGGLGLASLGVAAGFGIDGLNALAEQVEQCGPDRRDCPPSYNADASNARKDRGLGLFVGFGLAGAAAVTAAVVGLVQSSNDSAGSRVTFIPAFGKDGAGVGAVATF